MGVPLIFIPVITYVITQSIKAFLIFQHKGKLYISDALRSGGMPSVHSATSTSLAIALLKNYGLYSPYTAIAFLLASIVIYDAVGVRYAVSRHAIEINKINTYLIKTQCCKDEKHDDICKLKPELSEYIGHTIPEAIVGTIFGAVLGFILS